MAIRAILFDKDGTLLDFTATWMPAIRAAAQVAARGDPDLSDRLLEVGGYDAAAKRLLPDRPLSAGNAREIAAVWEPLAPGWSAEALTAELDRIFEDRAETDARPVTDLAALFRRLKGRGLRLGVASSDSARGIAATLRAFDVLPMLDFLAGYDSGFGAKPDPGVVLAFAARTALEPGAVAVVGDNACDLEMGYRAGAGLRVGVLSGTAARVDLAPLADHVLDSIAGLEALLDEIATGDRP